MSNLKDLKVNTEGVGKLLLSDQVMNALKEVAPTKGEIVAHYRNVRRCVVKVKEK